ncbi:hypothetical protein Barb4_00970 [Bacteroidales bacterium Barb4]|nr:hypothetical protein Barb4_00970 [Bacteroidales bacterium Barb4]
MRTAKFFSVLILVMGLMSCADKKQVTAEQVTANRGVKLQVEACEELAMASPLRAAGNGVSQKESFAKSIAVLSAKSNLGRALGEQVSGMIRTFNQQHSANAASDLVGKDSELNESYFEQFLTNVRVICSNTYVQKDGSYNAYVCVEMEDESLSSIHKKLSDDKKIPIDFAKDQFKKEMEKAKEITENNNPIN